MDNQALKVGDVAPGFELMDENKTVVKLSDLRGKKVVLLFYPMDFSPVCTQEFCTFGPDLGKTAGGADAAVFGVSCDSPFSHAAFKKQYGIAYTLLADPTRKMAKAYGMWAGEEPYNCTKRGTVVIDKDGKIAFYQEVAMREPAEGGGFGEASGGVGICNLRFAIGRPGDFRLPMPNGEGGTVFLCGGREIGGDFVVVGGLDMVRARRCQFLASLFFIQGQEFGNGIAQWLEEGRG